MQVKFGPESIEAVLIANDLHPECGLLANVDVELFDQCCLIAEIEVFRSSDDILQLLRGDRDWLVI